ncbi:MAG: transglutaminase domain-containing protein [Sedimentisphaerales bacterium]|nr:transglutaminase domain-containing protein [Sedimentisphaerales bacterium]
MKLRTLILILLVCSAPVKNANGRLIPKQKKEGNPPAGKTAGFNNIVEFDISHTLTITGNTRRIILTVVVPKTIPDRQNILDIKYSPQPSRIFEQNDNHYAEFIFYKPDKQIEVDINVTAELLRYDLFTAKKKPAANHVEETELAGFLKSEKFIEKDHGEIREIAAGIKGQTEEEILRRIYNYVIVHLDYTKNGKKQWGAVKALQMGTGDCSEYSDLFVALCRAKNIPARVITGYTARFDSQSPKHNWVEVYLKDYGWIPFEPSWGDVKNPGIQNMAFSRMIPVYLYLSHTRNDEILQNYHYAAYKYWGDNIKLTDSIELRRPNPLQSK